jgi:hypothetical protein
MHKRLSILLRVLVIALAVSGSVVHALSLRGFLEGYVGSSGGGQVQDASPEDIQTSVTTNEISSIDPKNAQVLYTTPGLAGSYKATLTIDVSENKTHTCVCVSSGISLARLLALNKTRNRRLFLCRTKERPRVMV